MKVMTLTAALAVTLAMPAFAQSTTTILAVEQFNESADAVTDVIDPTAVTEGVAVPTEGATALALAMELVGDDNGLGYASIFPSEPSAAADIFERLAAE